MGEEIVMVPAGLPALSRGSHRHPTLGSCLMEYVSVLAGEPFSDRPGCTHPVLAELARKVNDRIGDSVRARLALLAPELIGSTGTHPGIAPTVLIRCADAGLAVDPEDGWLQHLRRRELVRLARQNETGPGWGWMRLGAGYRLLTGAPQGSVGLVFTRVTDILDRLNIPDRDQRLCVLLEQAVIDCRRLLGLPGPSWAPSGPGAVLRRAVS